MQDQPNPVPDIAPHPAQRQNIAAVDTEQVKAAASFRVHCSSIPEAIRELRERNLGVLVVEDGGHGAAKVTLDGKPVEFIIKRSNRYARASERINAKNNKRAKSLRNKSKKSKRRGGR
jgi:hypothetical protein